MAETSQLAEIETGCDVPSAVQNDGTSMEQGTTLMELGRAQVSQLPETVTSSNVSIPIEKDCTKDPTSKEVRSRRARRWAEMPEPKGNVLTAIQNEHTNMEQSTMLRVPRQLLEVNKNAYEPYVISFGPYHRGEDHLKRMEGRKRKSLDVLLQQTNQSVEIYRSAMSNIVEAAQNCYAKPLNLSKEEFIEMMVHDGCFIVQLIMETLEDSFCTGGLIWTSIWRDLVLLENQLPFFVLCELLDIIPKTFLKLEGSTDPKSRFIAKILKAFEWKMPGLKLDKTYDDNSIKNVKHIVHLLHSNWLPSEDARDEYEKVQPKEGTWPFIRPATELSEAGIEFEMVGTQSLFDIKFEKGKLKMPKVTIGDDTESLYRNFIACEQLDNKLPVYLVDYVKLMDSLINTGKDAELLCKSKIIDNLLGDDESVAALFNRLGNHASFSRKGFFYAQLFNDINKHYKKPWNTMKANLRQKYFNTPWAFISFFAATLLLLLTVLQTTFTIFPRS